MHFYDWGSLDLNPQQTLEVDQPARAKKSQHTWLSSCLTRASQPPAYDPLPLPSNTDTKQNMSHPQPDMIVPWHRCLQVACKKNAVCVGWRLLVFVG